MVTAEDYLENVGGLDVDNPKKHVEETMIEFAKLHVEEALKQASEEAKAWVDGGGDWVSSTTKAKVNKESILNAYPLANIK